MWTIGLEVKDKMLSKVLERLSDLEDKGLFKIGGVRNDENNLDIIKEVIDMIEDMREAGNFHNPTLDELEQRLV
jgi:hypothetical protein